MKTTLIGKSGKLIAIKPKTSDMNEELLKSGLTSAILEYSKAIQNKDIQSINYQDKVTYFVTIKDFILLIEFTSTLESKLRNQILELLQKKAEQLLEDFTEETITITKGELILEEIVTQALDESRFGISQPFLDIEIGDFSILHTEDSYVISSSENCDDCITDIADLLDQGLRMDNFEPEDNCFSMYIPYDQFVYYLSIFHKDMISQVGVLKVPKNEDFTLFRLVPLLDREVKKQIFINSDTKMSELIPELTKIYDFDRKEFMFNPEYMSVKFLEKNVKQLEKAIYPLIIGKPIIVIGDRPSTKIIVRTLLLFTQHLSTEVIDWLVHDNQIGLNITGMSKEKYNELVMKKLLDDSITVINLDDGKTKSKYISTYIKKIYDQVKKKSQVLVYAFIGSELEKIAKIAIEINGLALLDESDAIEKLKQIKVETKNESRFGKAIRLALFRNTYLRSILKSALK
ncbi:MAG: hypothetical protein FK733_13390 [Asgard group archaeon]|nr:hypothetical protein [Asgard group archaeon]